MSASDFIINDMNAMREAAYDQIENAIRDLYALNTAESAIVMSVRIIYRDIEEEVSYK